MADKTLGQVAYEKYVQVFARPVPHAPWGQLRPPVRGRWEAIAAAVIGERERRNAVTTALADAGRRGDRDG